MRTNSSVASSTQETSFEYVQSANKEVADFSKRWAVTTEDAIGIINPVQSMGEASDARIIWGVVDDVSAERAMTDARIWMRSKGGRDCLELHILTCVMHTSKPTPKVPALLLSRF